MSFEPIITNLGRSIDKINSSLHTVFEGKHVLSVEDRKKASANKRIQDIGISGLLDLFASVDLCNVLSYGANQSSDPNGNSNTFNPQKVPDNNSSSLVKKKWRLQKKAYDIQKQIDGYYIQYGDTVNKNDLSKLVQDLVSTLSSISSGENSINDPDLLATFPELALLNNFTENSIGFLSANTDLRNVPNENIQKTVAFVDNIKQVTIKIQALSNPLSAAINFLSPKLRDDLNKIQKVIDPARIIPAIKTVSQSAVAARNASNQIMSIVRVAQVFVRIATLLIKVFTVILAFLIGIPIPSIFTTTGIQTASASAYAKLLEKLKSILTDLKAMTSLLTKIIDLCASLSLQIGLIIEKINLVLINLELCNNAPTDLMLELTNVRDDLQKSVNELNNFVDNHSKKKEISNNKFGNYTISIITEQVVSTSIKLIRRYGVALDYEGKIAVQSTPTFASDDNIIIQEVKLLLSSKGLISSVPSSLTADELTIIEEALNFLQDDNVNQDLNVNIDTSIDSPDNENENSGLGLNAFVNKLSGGKKLRKRMRQAMANSTNQLNTNLASTKAG
jgi:hypothetical protein